MTNSDAPTVLVIDDDLAIGRLVQAVLTDEGYEVAQLHDTSSEAVARTVGRLEPDCILLDGQGGNGYGESWELAESLATRSRPVPVVMFTAHGGDIEEAKAGETHRTRAARFSGVLGKPFDLDDLLAIVQKVVGRSVPFDRSPAADAQRTQELVKRLEDGGATDVRSAARREWATFRAPDGRVTQLYWWQKLGLYLCGAYDEETGRMRPIGEFPDRDLAIECVLLPEAEQPFLSGAETVH